MKKKSVVVVGGGNGAAVTLRALKPFAGELVLTGIISMSDSAGSSGALRRQFQTLPPGDILRVILALSPYDYDLLKKIFFSTRFDHLQKIANDSHHNRPPNLGNLFLVLLAQYEGDFMAAVKALCHSVGALGTVLPVTLDQTELCAELDNGIVIKSEGEIAYPHFDRSLQITKVWLDPAGKVYPPAREALLAADMIILGPGDVYTSLAATLLPEGVCDAIAASQAKLVSIWADGQPSDGEPAPRNLSGLLAELQRYVPRPIDIVIYNNAALDARQQAFYSQNNWQLIEKDPERLNASKVIGVDFEDPAGGYSAAKLSAVLREII